MQHWLSSTELFSGPDHSGKVSLWSVRLCPLLSACGPFSPGPVVSLGHPMHHRGPGLCPSNGGISFHSDPKQEEHLPGTPSKEATWEPSLALETPGWITHISKGQEVFVKSEKNLQLKVICLGADHL